MFIKPFFITCISVFSSLLVLSQSVDTLPKKLFNVTFRVDLSGELKNVRSLSSIGIRGNRAPLSWQKTYIMKGNGQTGIYEATIPFWSSESAFRIRYKYIHDSSAWESSEERAILVQNSSSSPPVDRWNIVTLVNRGSYQDSLEGVELYSTVVSLDSMLFGAYNACKLDEYGALFSLDLEFYHDKGGLSTGRKEMVEAVRNNICGKVRRDLVKGSIEVSPIPGYGAVETGEHRFFNIKEQSLSRPGKFTIIWQKKNNKWEATRVISLH